MAPATRVLREEYRISASFVWRWYVLADDYIIRAGNGGAGCAFCWVEVEIFPPLAYSDLTTLAEKCTFGNRRDRIGLRDVNSLRRFSLVLGVCWLWVFPACAADRFRALTSSEDLELKTLTGQLADSGRSAKTRREAAALLLTRPYPQAGDALRGFLSGSDTSTQIVVAEAIAQYGDGREQFVDPLMAMLTGKEPTIRAPAGRALVTYKNHGVTDKLVMIALDVQQDKAVRLVTIEALQSVLDKLAVDALMQLLDDKDAAISDAALESLAKLTNIRTFGKDRKQWKRWWRRNQDKDRSEWLADLAESLGRAKTELEAENALLQKRLVKAMQDLYAATPAAQRDAMLLSFLKDPLADVRTVGLALTDRKLAAGEVPEEIRTQVQELLGDPDARVRRGAALLTANLGDGAALALLLAQLKKEDVPEARAGLLAALGQYGDPKATGAVLADVSSEFDEVAAAAATALAKIAAVQPLDPRQGKAATQALVARYRQAEGGENGEALREALLGAMGIVGDGGVQAVLQDALKDAAATVRLAAVNGLARQGNSVSASALEPLVDDPDRGVRRATISALKVLGGQTHLSTILKRTNPKVETDPAVRKQAWDVAMEILAKADAKVLASVAASLAERDDAADQRIQILQRLVESLEATNGGGLAGARRQLGLALIHAKRPAEAAGHLGAAHKDLAATKDPEAAVVWLEWVDALLGAADPAAVRAIAEQESEKHFAEGVERLEARLAALGGEENYAAVVLLVGEAKTNLLQRLTAPQRRSLDAALADARAKQLAEDRKGVTKLVGQLAVADEAVATAARAELRKMGDRAVGPLLAELQKCLTGEAPDAAMEKAVLTVLRQIAPKLTGYDAAAPLAERQAVVDGWIQSRAGDVKAAVSGN